ncbi:hypothetical protein LguiA_004380 [Lonicera macranthoides]
MKLTWKKTTQSNNINNKKRPLSTNPNLPFDQQDDDHTSNKSIADSTDGLNDAVLSKTLASTDDETTSLAESFRNQGNKLAEDGKYREALGKWEAALTLMPDRAVLHEQKAQVLLEIGDAWSALKAATRATELEPSWSEAWVTLGRAQLNFGEPDSAIESFDRALAIKPDLVEGQDDRQTASKLVKKRKQLQSSGLSETKNRFMVGEKD